MPLASLPVYALVLIVSSGFVFDICALHAGWMFASFDRSNPVLI